MLKHLALALSLMSLSVAPAFAHLNAEEHGSLLAGVSHPLFGVDHILAMVAVGLWAALLGGSALWLVPSAFVGTMAIGFAAAGAGAPRPFIEPVILASVVVIGLLTAVALKVPAWAGMVMGGFFAFFHGYAHGGALSFGFGFALSTALLHATGVGLGLGIGCVLGGETGRLVTRIAGGATALGGLWLALGA